MTGDVATRGETDVAGETDAADVTNGVGDAFSEGRGKRALRCLLHLMGCALNGTVPSTEFTTGMDDELVLCLARHHSVSALAAVALMSAGIPDPRWKAAYDESSLRQALMGVDREAVLAGLEGLGIRYVTLKGIRVAALYPDPATREMADNDILFECPDMSTRAAVRELMVSLGFTVDLYEKGNEDVYLKEPFSNFEMHVALFPGAVTPRESDYYADVWDRVVPDGVGRACRLTPTDSYVYVVAHMFKHYQGGGCGLRTLSDLYVLNCLRGEFQDAVDHEAAARELAVMGAEGFESDMRELSSALLSDPYGLDASIASLGPTPRAELAYLAGSGTYGTETNMIDNKLRRMGADDAAGSVLRYVARRLVPPVDQVCSQRSVIDRHRWLLPLYYPYRLVRGAVVNHDKIGREVHHLADVLRGSNMAYKRDADEAGEGGGDG